MRACTLYRQPINWSGIRSIFRSIRLCIYGMRCLRQVFDRTIYTRKRSRSTKKTSTDTIIAYQYGMNHVNKILNPESWITKILSTFNALTFHLVWCLINLNQQQDWLVSCVNIGAPTSKMHYRITMQPLAKTSPDGLKLIAWRQSLLFMSDLSTAGLIIKMMEARFTSMRVQQSRKEIHPVLRKLVFSIFCLLVGGSAAHPAAVSANNRYHPAAESRHLQNNIF